MTDIAGSPSRAPDIRESYLAQARSKRVMNLVLLVIFVALLAGGFRVADGSKRGRLLEWSAKHFGFSSRCRQRGVPWLIGPLRRVLDILRAVPEIVIALVLIFLLGGGPIPAMIAIALHTVGALGKLFSEVNENASLKPIEGLESVGASWSQRMWLGVVPQAHLPDWVSLGDQTVIDLGRGHIVTFGKQVTYDVPDYGLIVADPGPRGVQLDLPKGDVPDFISASKNRLMVMTDAGRLTVTRNRAEVFKYDYGWELFFFTLDSPYHGLGIVALAKAALNGEAGAILQEFWTNKMWRHGDVAWALFETILMAFLGTFGAAIIALPLGFLAAKNFSPLGGLRFAARRMFDFLRGVDGLIWTIVLSRAFGPGPLTGSLAILLTDTGSFGKMFSEALENVDQNQIEGITSTGAKPLQRYRFGVIPQITPVLLSQILYYLESNTRSATIIGAITGGGIGLLLTQAIITQKDWEEGQCDFVARKPSSTIFDRNAGFVYIDTDTTQDRGVFGNPKMQGLGCRGQFGIQSGRGARVVSDA
ncbi:Phosphonate transport system permease protein PhnE [Nymphon striatum]|nr:Phosphonate transport system permease protein PhnE [Nymphon striatum]